MSKSVSLPIEQLILGRKLKFPIHGADGILLIASGVVLTTDIKHRLLSRGIRSVAVDETEVSRLTIETPQAVAEQLSDFDDEINRRIEEFLHGGTMQVQNTGPAVSESVVQHGTQGYEKGRLAELSEEQEKITSQTDAILTDVSRSGGLDVPALNAMVDTAIDNLTNEFGCTLTSAFSVPGGDSLARHAIQMATLGMATGVEMSLDNANLHLIGCAGLLSDVGMATVPAAVRNKEGSLSVGELVDVQRHAVRTANLLEPIDDLPRLVKIIAYQVHERPDGSGYPRGRIAAGIHPFAQVLHVADAYTAMTSPRADRPALIPYYAMAVLIQQANNHRIDSNVVHSLLRVLSLFPIGSYVALSDGCIARVVRANGADFTNPIVIRIADENGQRIDPFGDAAILDLSQSDETIIQALPTPGSGQTHGTGRVTE